MGMPPKLILSEVNREHGQHAVEKLIRELHLDDVLGFVVGTLFDGRLVVPDKHNPQG